jgi:hypothetical protein
LSRNHLGLGGLAELYKQNFWTKYSHQVATVLANTCARCAITTVSNEKFLQEGRFARPPYQGHTYSIDIGYWREDMKPLETGSLLQEWEIKMQLEHEEMLRNSRLPTELRVGQLVFRLNSGNLADKKHTTKWKHDIHQITDIRFRKVEIKPLFSAVPASWVHADQLKSYKCNKILETLPEDF